MGESVEDNFLLLSVVISNIPNSLFIFERITEVDKVPLVYIITKVVGENSIIEIITAILAVIICGELQIPGSLEYQQNSIIPPISISGILAPSETTD